MAEIEREMAMSFRSMNCLIHTAALSAEWLSPTSLDLDKPLFLNSYNVKK